MTVTELGFRETLKRDLASFVDQQRRRFAEDETLVIDLHCHDRNSDVPDELLGRILHWPETWVSTDEVREVLAANGASALTITNHNNARSCYELRDRGIDVLVGAEFTCVVPDFDVHVHVLTYGFTPAQEQRLGALRPDLYRFLAYAREQDLVTVLAHPLYFYSTRRVPTLPLLEKLTLLFDNFEVLNGQRDTWQNLLVIAWLESLTEERVAEMSARCLISTELCSCRPVHKAMTGGSDDHMALFVAATGSRVRVPDLAARLETTTRSALVLEALKRGDVAPFGGYACEEKLGASFLDYFCQIVRHASDPGLVRMLLHQGSTRQKLWAFLIANGMAELRRHRYTSRFIDAAHEALHGKHVGFMQKYVFAGEYRSLVKELDRIAGTRDDGPGSTEAQLRTSVPAIFRGLNQILASRIAAKVQRYEQDHPDDSVPGLQQLVERLELPADLRRIFGGADESRSRRMSSIDLRSVAEGLPFPAMAALVIGGSTYASTKVLFANRPLLDDFSRAIHRYEHPRRVLWLTDTFSDKNGVASVLQLMHGQAVRRELPIDFAVCHGSARPDGHLKVLRPVLELPLAYYPDQPVRAFDLMELQRLFIDGAYDRVVCSTEGLMGLAALYLKNAFSVPAFFYVHTDWIDFARRTLKLDVHNTDRVRRLLRAFYHGFDGLFVLNSEQLGWFASDAMGIGRERLRQTAHWPDERFVPRSSFRRELLPAVRDDERTILFVGRVSEEKGALELPALIDRVRREVPKARLVVAGTGPAEDRLRAMVPGGVFLSWLDIDRLSKLYSSADVLVLPSHFDTFGCVVVEALASGLPVVAYATKGPKDIIEDTVCGFTVSTEQELAAGVVRVLSDPDTRAKMSVAAVERAKAYRADKIMDGLLQNLGVTANTTDAAAGEPFTVHSPVGNDELGAWHTEPPGSWNN
ncbi:MAG: glycosyltransferase [Polyangiaceae bacterium]|nr:glycosyltransferase [Polyangiaceae bacterium]